MSISWQRIEPTKIQKVGYRTIVTKTFVLPDGIVGEYVTKEGDDARSVAVLALTPENKVIIARQFRPGPERIMDELPGGGVEAGEAIKDAAIRELAEETGYVPEALEYLGESSYDAYTNGHRYYFLATGCRLSSQGQSLDEYEYVEVQLISIDELIENAR